MRSMTDFIDSINVDNIPSVYNEDYSLAEEYSEYFNESSDVYAGDIFNSSGYQFFGEAAFYQEASKGLIAGGILALVSGAFFMIMKLLKNGGSGGGSTSSSKSSSTGSKKRSSKSEPDKSVARTVQHANDVQNVVSKKAEESKKELNSTFDSLETPKTPKPVETPKQETPKGTKKENKAPEEPKPEPQQEKIKYEELEAEEKLTFNVEIIVKELMKFKKQGYDDVAINGGDIPIVHILKGLEQVEEITDYMVRLVKERKWFMFESTDDKDNVFLKKCRDFDEIVDKMKNEAKKYNGKDKMNDVNIDGLINDFNRINKITKEIEDKCKEGMKACREEREKLKAKEQSVARVDLAYKTFNKIIRDVNSVCKILQNAFKTVHKAAMGKRFPFPMSTNYYHIYAIYGEYDPIYKDTPQSILNMITNTKNPLHLTVNRMYEYFTTCLTEEMMYIFDATDGTQITEWDIDQAENNNAHYREDSLKKLDKAQAAAERIFETLKDRDQTNLEVYKEIEAVVVSGYNAIRDLLNVPIRKFVGSKINDCEVPEFKKCHDMYLNYFVKSGEKRKELEAKIKQIAESKEVKMDSLPPNTPVGKFYDDIGKNMNKLEGVLEDRYLSRFKSSYEKGLKMFNDPDEDDEDVFSEIYQSLIKNVWERQTSLSNDNLKHLISFLSSIGFKEANFSEGKKIKPQDGKYFEEIFKQPTDDASLNFTIKKIYEHPMEMNISLEGDDFNAILPGKISMYRIDETKMSTNMAKVSDKAYAEKSEIPRYRDLNVGWDDLTPEEQKERERYYAKYKSKPAQKNTKKQKEFEFA